MAIITNSASLTFNNERTASSNEVDTEVRESQSVAIVKTLCSQTMYRESL